MAKRAKKKVVKNPKVPRTRAANTLTESQYFNKIRQALRKEFRYWKPASIAAELCSRPHTGPNKALKKEYLCNGCKEWFPRKMVQIDHIEECGSLRCYEDLVPFLKRLTTESISGFQVLCVPCHKIKTHKKDGNEHKNM